MYVCQTITFKSIDIQSAFFAHVVYLHEIRVKFIYEGHRVKVKGTKSCKYLFMHLSTSFSNFQLYLPDGATCGRRHACFTNFSEFKGAIAALIVLTL